MKVFLSYQFKDNISGITALLKELNVEIFDSMTDMEYGSSLQQAFTTAIAECDFVFLVYSETNPHIAFEAGIAVSMNKPIFSVISEYGDDPVFLFDSTYVHAQPKEVDKIKFNLSIFLDNIQKRVAPIKIKKQQYYGGGFPNYYPMILENYKKINKNSEQDYEAFFKDIFEKYGLNVIQNKLESRLKFTTDFCIWSDKLNNVLGNPILVEIKKEISANNLYQLSDTLTRIFNNYPAESCLIFYDHLVDIDKRKLPNSPKCLYIQINDLIEKLNHNDFNESIRKIRNEIVHNK